jgi:hypothetical protein
MLCKLMKVEPDPFLIFTSNNPGLVVATEIFGKDNDQVAYLHDDEFKKFKDKHPDADYVWHINFWSYFDEPMKPDGHDQLAEGHPIPEGNVYWMHHDGILWGPLHGRGLEHLWKWDGEEPELIQEAYSTVQY